MNAGDSPLLAMAKRIALTHHMHCDGSGYPLGLAGHDIQLEGRITPVADVFDALSSRYPYKPPFPIGDIMSEGQGTQLDPTVLDAFMSRRADIIRIHIEISNDE